MWIEPPCSFLSEDDRKSTIWDNKQCFETHPDDMAEIRARFEIWKQAEKNRLYAVVCLNIKTAVFKPLTQIDYIMQFAAVWSNYH